jgi:hypothetical protein
MGYQKRLRDMLDSVATATYAQFCAEHKRVPELGDCHCSREEDPESQCPGARGLRYGEGNRCPRNPDWIEMLGRAHRWLVENEWPPLVNDPAMNAEEVAYRDDIVGALAHHAIEDLDWDGDSRAMQALADEEANEQDYRTAMEDRAG